MRRILLLNLGLAIVLLSVFQPVTSWAWRYGKVVVVSGPVLSAATASADGPDFAQLAVTTNTGSGTLFWVISSNCSTPTAVQIIAGHDQGGGAPSPGNAGSQAVSISGVQSLNPSGLTGVTTYCAFFAQTATGNSNVAASASFGTGGTLSFTVQTTAAWDAAQGATFNAVVTNALAAISACLSPAVNVTAVAKFDYGATGGSNATTNADTFPDFYSSSLRAALIALPGKSSVQSAIYNSSMPASDPTGLGDTYYVTRAHYRGLGLSNTPGNPDWVTLYNNGVTWDTTVNGTCSGNPCLWTDIWHESSEGLGRQSGVQQTGQASLIEFTSYSGAGVRNVTTSGARFPSIDAGVTNLITPFQYSQSADLADWTSAGVDPFTAFNSGPQSPISVRDIKEMNKMGWGLKHSCRITAGL